MFVFYYLPRSQCLLTTHFKVEFCQHFIKCNGLAALLELLSGSDDGVRLVAAKGLTVAAYTSPDLSRSDTFSRGGGAVLAGLLRTENEFVRYFRWCMSNTRE